MYIHEFSPILQITLRSKFLLTHHRNHCLLNGIRVLLATIRDQGLSPCPRCLMPKARFDRMGLKPNIAFRLQNVRKFLSGLVTSARNAIYKHVRSIGGSVVDRILKPTSSVPTMVGSCFCRLTNALKLSGRMPSLRD